MGDEDHPITSGTFFGIPRTPAPVIKSIDTEKRVIIWEA